MNIDKFKGTGVALITPFRQDKSIDFNALEKLVNFQIENGTDFLVALGTTSEAATLTKDERSAVVDFIIEVNNKRLPIVVGCGSNNTSELIKSVKEFEKPGIDGILSVTPYYNKPNQKGIYEHFKALAQATKLPIILYNVPGRTSSNINAETALKLANDFSNIIAIKEASGDLSQMMQIVKNKPENFLVLSGDDALTLPLIATGFDGVISVVANAYPASFSKMVKLTLANKFTEAREIHYQLIDIIDSLFAEGNPAGVKAFMQFMNLIEDNVRLPLVPVSKELNAIIEKQFNDFK